MALLIRCSDYCRDIINVSAVVWCITSIIFCDVGSRDVKVSRPA